MKKKYLINVFMIKKKNKTPLHKLEIEDMSLVWWGIYEKPRANIIVNDENWILSF